MAGILLVACYESGFQPLHLAQPAALLRQRGLDVTVLDLSVQSLQDFTADAPAGIAISVPMHTALHLGVSAARTLRSRFPAARICFFGLYAGLNAGFLQDSGLADRILAGEIEEELADWAQTAVAGIGNNDHTAIPDTGQSVLVRLSLPVPDRQALPPLAVYARLQTPDGTLVRAGQTVTSRGCLHTCRHCPVVPVYGGRFFVVSFETVVADLRQQIEMGARHISFGDPDFLNGPGHSLRITEWLHTHYPHVTFDFTAKVEHLCRYRHHVETFREHGALFVISAFEAVQNEILQYLDKGHDVADMEQVLAHLRTLGLPLHPTWIPFTPWSTARDYAALLDWIERHGLVHAVPPVQLALRLLIPPRSWLLKRFGDSPWLGPLVPERFTYAWTHPDPAMDALQKDVENLVARLPQDRNHVQVFQHIRTLARQAACLPARDGLRHEQMPPPPRLTEDWFC